MLQGATIKFLKDLKKNNNKPWFDQHRNAYDSAKADFARMVAQLIKEISVFDRPIGALEAKECTFRINRDVRFSKDKTPYKNNMAAYFNKAGKKGNLGGYYLHVEPGSSFVAGGLWVPEPAILASIRQELDYSFDEWNKIINTPTFKKVFPGGVKSEATLTRPPRGYDEHNPAIEFLKMKNFAVKAPISDTVLQSKSFEKDVAKLMAAMKPMIDFLNRAGD